MNSGERAVWAATVIIGFTAFGLLGVGAYFATGSGPAPQPSYTRAEFDAEYRRGLTDGARQATLDAPQCKCGFREYLGKPCVR